MAEQTNTNKEEQIKVIGSGFGRTGTNSLQVALNELGYNTYHFTDVLKHKHMSLWITQNNKKNKNITEAIFKKNNYTACVDFPAASLYVI